MNEATKIFLKLYWKYLFTVTWPLLTALVFIYDTDIKVRCLYVELIMCGYWVSLCVPDSLTALIPIILLPVLDIQPPWTTCQLYFKYGFFVTSALFAAVVIEYTGIHERIIFYTSFKWGGSPRVTHFILSMVTFSVSVRVANAYAVQMMIPLVDKILEQIDVDFIRASNLRIQLTELRVAETDDKDRPVKLSTAFYCSVMYASIYGGINFVSGTTTNLTFRAIYQQRFPTCAIEQTTWFLYTVPVSLLCFITSFLWVQVEYFGLWRNKQIIVDRVKLLNSLFQTNRIMEKLYYELGAITSPQIFLSVASVIYFVVWYTEKGLYFLNMKEFGLFFYLESSIPFLFITFVMICLPYNFKIIHSFCSKSHKRPVSCSPSLLPWATLQECVPWGGILIVGAGITMGKAQLTSGLATALARNLAFIKCNGYYVNLCIITFVALWLTECTNNVITCGIFAPLVIELCIAIDIHPIVIGLPFTFTCSLGFLSTHASPYFRRVSEHIKFKEKYYFQAGIFPKMFSWFLILITFPYYGTFFFNNNTEPINFRDLNETCFCQPCTVFKNTFYKYI